MKYYLIAGEASGDLHASRLMQSLKQRDPEAEFRFFGGDQMASVGGTLVKHYRDLAYMGFIPVLLHLPTILRNMRMCKEDIREWQPHAVILIDYPGFNLKIAKYIKEQGARSKEQEDTTSPNISPAPCPLSLKYSTISPPKSGRGRSTASRTSSAMSMSCSPYYLSKWISLRRSTNTPYTM